jgi:acyl-CoA thioesterase-1
MAVEGSAGALVGWWGEESSMASAPAFPFWIRPRGFLRYGPARAVVNAAAAVCLLALVLTPGAAWAAPLKILAFGDSLTAGYGLAEAEGFPEQLEAALRGAGVEAEVLNGGVSGDTTAGGLARLDWALADKPDLVILELGSNDALRGLDPAATESNLDAMLERLAAAKVPVLLAGMLAPRNLGADYAEAFDAIYPRLAEKHDVPLYPFFLDGVATDTALNQADGIHPNDEGVAVIVERLLPHLLPLVEALEPASAS